ncbi:hypothetical protein ACFL55_03270, partial [Candidatus Latescibacterota bacterium]
RFSNRMNESTYHIISITSALFMSVLAASVGAALGGIIGFYIGAKYRKIIIALTPEKGEGDGETASISVLPQRLDR